MSHGSEDADPDLAAMVYRFIQTGGDVIYEIRQDRLTLTDLQIMKGTATTVLREIERAIQMATPIDLTRDPETICTCPPVKWTLGADVPTHMLRCPLFRPAPT